MESKKNHSWGKLDGDKFQCQKCPCQKQVQYLDGFRVTAYYLPGIGTVYHSPPCTRNLQTKKNISDELYSPEEVQSEQTKIDFNTSFVRKLKMERIML